LYENVGVKTADVGIHVGLLRTLHNNTIKKGKHFKMLAFFSIYTLKNLIIH